MAMKDYTKKNWNMENDAFRRRRRIKRLVIAVVCVIALIIIIIVATPEHSVTKNARDKFHKKPTPTSQYTTINLSIPAQGS